MNIEAEKARLLKIIDRYKKADSLAECTGIKAELAKIRKNKAAASNRIAAQKKAGDLAGAELSGMAYDFCCTYEKQLESIIDGYEHQSGEKYFTKDGRDRYRSL